MASSYCREPFCFIPPKWSRRLKNIPKKKFKLSQTPSIIHKWEDLPGVKDGYEVFIKREDMIGAALSGNKVRKLNFLLAEAIDMGCDCVITTGGLQSNHVRTTAIAAREVGLDSHVVLTPKSQLRPEDAPVTGNFLLDRLTGANVYLENEYDGDRFIALNRMMSSVKEKLILLGKNPYVINIGGASITGLWAYIDAFQEMIEQGVLDNFDDIFLPISTGGTAAGLGVGNYLNGSKLKIHAVLVANTVEMMYRQMNSELADLGLVNENGHQVKAEDLVDVIDGYTGELTQDDKGMLCKISTSTGIILDTVFTMKAVKGMLCEMENSPVTFNGTRILFLHTGGIFGNTTSGVLEESLLGMKDTNDIIRLSDIVDRL